LPVPELPRGGALTTQSELVDEVLAYLHSYTAKSEKYATLTVGLGPADLTVTHDGLPATAGLVEIDDELIYVSSVNSLAGTAAVPAWGRGQQGSSAAVHSENSKITAQPRFPRARVKAVINEVVQSLNPSLYGVGHDTSNTGSPTTVTYLLPAECDEVLEVRTKDPGPSEMWLPVRRWRADLQANVSDFASGRSIDIRSGVFAGQPIKITYRRALTAIPELGVLTDSGLEEPARDIVTLGAVGRLLMMLEPARLQTSSVEQNDREERIPVGSSSAVARQVLGLQAVRVEEERNRLNRLYQPSINYTR
jgi:hypothetical protein